MHDDLSAQVASYHQRIQTVLQTCLSESKSSHPNLHRAMHYAVMNGGKRMRPLLMYASAKALALNPLKIDDAASAVEIIHCYSLVHDDLPAMDDDDLRRGRASCHRAFDEATAILAGDALQALAFELLANNSQTPAETSIRLLACLAKACGSQGMAGGQAIDLAAVNQTLTIEELEVMHSHKTGDLIRAGISMVTLFASDMNEQLRQHFSDYGHCVGLAFQIHDDILDIEGESAVTGKIQGSDIALNKPTYPAAIGLAQSKIMAKNLVDKAISKIDHLGNRADLLRFMAEFAIKRAH